MTYRLFLIGASVAVAVAGCRTNPNTVLVERELRLQEDEIYRLHDCIQDYQMALASARRRIAALEEQLGYDDSDERPPTDLSGPDYFEPPEPRAEDEPSSPEPMPSVPIVPEVDLGKPNGASTEPDMPDPSSVRPSDSDELEAAPPWTPPGDASPDSPPPDSQPRSIDGASRGTADSAQVARVLVNRALTGGIDVDGQPGDEGLLVVVEPRDAKDRYLAAPAEITVVVLDPEADERIARWEYTAAETAELFHDSSFGRGIQLEMGWPDDSPPGRNLHVFVRYTTADGRKLEVDQPIRVEPRPESVAGWTSGPAQAARGVGEQSQMAASPRRPAPADPANQPDPDTRSPRTATRFQRPNWSPERR